MKLTVGRRFFSAFVSLAMIFVLNSFDAFAVSPGKVVNDSVYESMECDRIDELPDGGKVYVYNIDGVENRFPMPPEGFDSLTATDEQLSTYGIPPRPDKNDTDDYLSWVEIVDGYEFKPTPEVRLYKF